MLSRFESPLDDGRSMKNGELTDSPHVHCLLRTASSETAFEQLSRNGTASRSVIEIDSITLELVGFIN